MSDVSVGSSSKRGKLFVYADTFGLTRDERIELAETLLRRDVASWKNLTDRDVDRLLDAFEGAALITHLLSERDPRMRR
jgi:hypothetical protein